MRTCWALIAAALAVSCTREAPPEVSRLEERDHAQVHFAGDVYFGEAYRSALPNTSMTERYSDPLKALRPALSTAPVIANLESALTESTVSSFEGRKDYLHWSRPDATTHALARHGFVGLSLGNNHAMDYGVGALNNTRQNLEQHGLTPFGAGSTKDQARKPYELKIGTGESAVSVAVIGTYWYRATYDNVYRFYADDDRGGVRALTMPDIGSQIRAIKDRDPETMVVIFPHWGRNYKWRNKRQRNLGRSLIDAGADLIIGHGAHVYQEVERYRDRWILYGLGNLVFLSPGRYAENDAPPYSMLATVRWSPHLGGQARQGRSDKELILRFIASDNLATNYRPHLLTGDAFTSAHDALHTRSCRRDDAFCAASSVGVDELGPHVRLKL